MHRKFDTVQLYKNGLGVTIHFFLVYVQRLNQELQSQMKKSAELQQQLQSSRQQLTMKEAELTRAEQMIRREQQQIHKMVSLYVYLHIYTSTLAIKEMGSQFLQTTLGVYLTCHTTRNTRAYNGSAQKHVHLNSHRKCALEPVKHCIQL